MAATHGLKQKRIFECGNRVEIRHSGIAQGFHTLYCHLGRVHVNFGDEVKRGQVIATVGPCPGCVTHLHFEVTANYLRYDPETKVAGCFGDEKAVPTEGRPLTYPVRC